MVNLAPRIIQPRLLIVGDDPDMRDALGSLFCGAGHACQFAPDVASALEWIDRQPFDAVLSDIAVDGMSGLDLLDRLRVTHPALPFIVVTGVGGVPEAVEGIKRAAFGFAVKPCDIDELPRMVAEALEVRLNPGVTPGPAAAAPGAMDMALVGAGAAMRRLQTAIDRVARSSAPVLVTGETGVGKELVARAIHARSARASKPFIAVNTSAIPQELLEGEIFGHARGGFTGAVQSRRGLLTEADGGTLLLDEIGDMSFGPSGQAPSGSAVR